MRGVFVASGWSQGNFVGSYEVNFAPSSVVAIAALSRTTGEGTQACGISGFRDRDPNGVEHFHSFGGWWEWPNQFGGQNVTSVSFGVATGTDQWMKQVSEVQFW